MHPITRQEIAAALAGVEGLTAYETVPDNIVAGAAWPVWVSRAWLNGRPDGPRETEWRVYVALPNATPKGTVDEADPLIETVAQALVVIGLEIGLIEPVQAPATEGGAPIPLLRYSLTD